MIICNTKKIKLEQTDNITYLFSTASTFDEIWLLFYTFIPTAGECITWMTRTSVSGYFLKTDSKADAGKRKMVERVAARVDTVL